MVKKSRYRFNLLLSIIDYYQVNYYQVVIASIAIIFFYIYQGHSCGFVKHLHRTRMLFVEKGKETIT
jgi:hypothetical protein